MLTLPEKEQQKKMKMKRKEKTFRANILFIYIVEEKGDNEKKENDTKIITVEGKGLKEIRRGKDF